jgi:hypothetical protein
MTNRVSSIALLTVVLSWTAFAQTTSPMREGSWEVAVKMSVEGMNMEMPPMKSTQCITAAMLKDPASAVPKGPGGGSSDCKVTDYKFVGSTATYKMSCTQPVPMNAVGEMRYSGTDAYTGTLKMESQGQKMAMDIDAKRLGDCVK